MHEERLFDWAIVASTAGVNTAPTYQVGLIGDLHMHCRINSLYMASATKIIAAHWW